MDRDTVEVDIHGIPAPVGRVIRLVGRGFWAAVVPIAVGPWLILSIGSAIVHPWGILYEYP
jgi:hypothetical protein